MTTNYSGAVEEMFTRFNSLWASKATPIVGYVPVIYWPGIDDGTLPDCSRFYLRLNVQTALTKQATLSENVVVNGSQRFTTYGVWIAELHAPKRKDSITKGRELCEAILSIFRASTANVTLRNARIREMPSENGAVRFNVITEFEFDEIA